MKKREIVGTKSCCKLLMLGAAVLKALPHDMAPEVAEGWIGDSRSLKKVLRGVLMHPENINRQDAKINEYLRLLSGDDMLMLDALDGKETLVEASEVFAYIDSDFKKWSICGNEKATKETAVEVYELIKDGKFYQFFTSFAVDDNLDRLCFTQAQIKNFCVKHRNWLRTDGYATFFLFKSNVEYFVASVYYLGGNKFEVRVSRFGHYFVSFANHKHRVIFPKLAV